jgi:hypothetical protein
MDRRVPGGSLRSCTSVRAAGQAFCYNFGRAASAFFIQGVALVAVYSQISTGMVVMASIAQLCALGATFLLPETAGNQLRDLEPEPR